MSKIINLLKIFIPVLMIIGLTGCVNIKNTIVQKRESAETMYFHKGVYRSFSPYKKSSYRDYLYVFYDENSGYTDDVEMGIGLPFSCVQTSDSVKFKFGGSEEPETIFKIKFAGDKIIAGSFEDDLLLIFIRTSNTIPDN